MPLADLYYQQQRHKDAIRYFELALQFEKKRKEIDWALLRLANSYINDKQPAKGKAILQKLPKQAKDKLIKQIAAEKDLDLATTVATKK
jgi:TolA-binding protein